MQKIAQNEKILSGGGCGGRPWRPVFFFFWRIVAEFRPRLRRCNQCWAFLTRRLKTSIGFQYGSQWEPLNENHLGFHLAFNLRTGPVLSAKSWNLLNKGMKYWDSALNAPGSRRFIAIVHIAAVVIGWKRSGKERTEQTQFSIKFAAKLSFIPRWSPVYFLFLFFEISCPMWPNRGSGAILSDFIDNFNK
jgi:hypothetical protein